MPSKNDYKPTLIRMMSHLDDYEYEYEQVFTPEQLGELTPDSIMKWLNHEVFGEDEPPEGHTIRPNYRKSTVEYWKKAISSFMPNQIMQWNELSNVGNPTRSLKVNKLIAKLRRLETRGQGAPSQVRRALQLRELCLTVCKLREAVQGEGLVETHGTVAAINVVWVVASQQRLSPQQKGTECTTNAHEGKWCGIASHDLFVLGCTAMWQSIAHIKCMGEKKQ